MTGGGRRAAQPLEGHWSWSTWASAETLTEPETAEQPRAIPLSSSVVNGRVPLFRPFLIAIYLSCLLYFNFFLPLWNRTPSPPLPGGPLPTPFQPPSPPCGHTELEEVKGFF